MSEAASEATSAHWCSKGGCIELLEHLPRSCKEMTPTLLVTSVALTIIGSIFVARIASSTLGITLLVPGLAVTAIIVTILWRKKGCSREALVNAFENGLTPRRPAIDGTATPNRPRAHSDSEIKSTALKPQKRAVGEHTLGRPEVRRALYPSEGSGSLYPSLEQLADSDSDNGNATQ